MKRSSARTETAVSGKSRTKSSSSRPPRFFYLIPQSFNFTKSQISFSLFVVLHSTGYYFTDMETLTLPMNGWRIWAFSQHLQLLSRKPKRSLCICCDIGPHFLWSLMKVHLSLVAVYFNQLGYWGFILTQIPKEITDLMKQEKKPKKTTESLQIK